MVVVGFEIFMLILLKIRFGVLIFCVVIIWIVNDICDSLLLEVILVMGCSG